MIQKIRSRFSAVDPGHQRLKQATAISLGMVLSAAASLVLIDLTKASAGLLTISIILAMLVGRMPHDSTSRKRCATTALMLIPISVGAVLSVSLSGSPVIQIALLIAVVGAATWVRMYGARATVLGSGAFFGYFFPLLMHLDADDMLPFLGIATIAVGSQTLVRAVLIIEFPRNQFLTLKHEFLRVSAVALHTASLTGNHQARLRHTQIQRLDTVARSISSWQKAHDSEQYLGCNDFQLSSLVLNARMDLEDSIAQLSGFSREAMPAVSQHENAVIHDALFELQRILDPQTHSDHAAQAAERIASMASRSQLSDPVGSAVQGLAHTAASFISLRAVASGDTISEPVAKPGLPAPASSASVHTGSLPEVSNTQPAPATPKPKPKPKPKPRLQPQRSHLRHWRLWQPASKMSLQIMAATALATVTGQAISATHWYWAVLTVFVVFVGGTSRASILTRASRRIFGTVGGLACGVVIVLLFHDQKIALVALSVIAAFCMMYFGPIKYSYTAFFMSTMLVGLYGLSGSLDTKVVLLRIDETVIGAIIGVGCAYLLFSSNTQPELQKRNDSYFSAVNSLLDDAYTVFTPTSLENTPPNVDHDLLEAVRRLDNAYEDIRAFTSDIAVAFIGVQSSQNEPDLHRLFVSTHLAEQLSREILRRITSHRIAQVGADDRRHVQAAIRAVQATAQNAADFLRDTAEGTTSLEPAKVPAFTFTQTTSSQSSEVSSLLEVLHRLNWSLQQIATKSRESDPVGSPAVSA